MSLCVGTICERRIRWSRWPGLLPEWSARDWRMNSWLPTTDCLPGRADNPAGSRPDIVTASGGPERSVNRGVTSPPMRVSEWNCMAVAPWWICCVVDPVCRGPTACCDRRWFGSFEHEGEGHRRWKPLLCLWLGTHPVQDVGLADESCWHKKNAYRGPWPNRLGDSWVHIRVTQARLPDLVASFNTATTVWRHGRMMPVNHTEGVTEGRIWGQTDGWLVKVGCRTYQDGTIREGLCCPSWDTTHQTDCPSRVERGWSEWWMIGVKRGWYRFGSRPGSPLWSDDASAINYG